MLTESTNHLTVSFSVFFFVIGFSLQFDHLFDIIIFLHRARCWNNPKILQILCQFVCVIFKRNLWPFTGKVHKCKHWFGQHFNEEYGSIKIKKNKNAFNILLSTNWLVATTLNTHTTHVYYHNEHAILHLISFFPGQNKTRSKRVLYFCYINNS